MPRITNRIIECVYTMEKDATMQDDPELVAITDQLLDLYNRVSSLSKRWDSRRRVIIAKHKKAGTYE